MPKTKENPRNILARSLIIAVGAGPLALEHQAALPLDAKQTMLDGVRIYGCHLSAVAEEG